MENNILRQHALTNVWAEPLQDRQYRIIPSRVSPQLGFKGVATVMWEGFPLPGYEDPLDKRTFHVYPLGQIPPHFFRLKMDKKKWYRADQLTELTNSTIDVVLENGAIVPNNLCYLYENIDQNFILAVERTSTDYGRDSRESVYGDVMDVAYSLDHRPLMIRFYTNAIQDSESWRGEKEDPIHVVRSVYKLINNANDLVSFKASVKAITDQYKDAGFGNYYVDGFYTDEPKAFSPEYKGKTLSFRFDETFRERMFFPISTIPGFRSIKDPKANKYLLVSPRNYERIDFCDDLDFYLVFKTATGYKGVMLDRFKSNTVRQVTHNAWSVREDVVLALSKQHGFLRNVATLEIMVVVRNGGMRHGLGFQKNRIEDLYHLPYDGVISAMADVNSTLDIWRAAELENSAYISVMSSNSNKITQAMVEEAYGYNAATKAVGRYFYKVTDQKKVKIDPLFSLSNQQFVPNGDMTRNSRVLFWYDKKGQLLSYETSNSIYTSISVPTALQGNAAYLEVMLGTLREGTDYAGTFRDKETVSDPYYGFFGHRCYVADVAGAATTNNWADVTGGIYYTYVPGTATKAPQIKWNYTLLNAAGLVPLTRFASEVNIVKRVVKPTDEQGYISIPLSVVDGGSIGNIGVAPGHVDVWIDGSPLMENLDYRYVTGGAVIILRQIPKNKEANILIRYYGYSNPKTKKPFGPRDTGFVKNGVVSMNNVFNVFHDRDVSVNIGGRKYSPDEVKFAEDGYVVGDYLDGAPYTIDEYQALVEPFTAQKTVDYQIQSMVIDQDVSDYLTARLPEPKPSNEFIEGQHWHLHSPIMAAYVEMMVKGYFTDAMIDLLDTEETFFSFTKQMVDVFKDFDPCIAGYNQDYVGVYPLAFKDRVVQVTQKQYWALEKINRLHLYSVLDLTHSIEVKPT